MLGILSMPNKVTANTGQRHCDLKLLSGASFSNGATASVLAPRLIGSMSVRLLGGFLSILFHSLYYHAHSPCPCSRPVSLVVASHCPAIYFRFARSLSFFSLPNFPISILHLSLDLPLSSPTVICVVFIFNFQIAAKYSPLPASSSLP